MIYGGGNSETYDYYIDATNGNDANNGSLYAPWKTLSKITGIPLAVNATVRVLIKQGTYNTADDYVLRSGSAGLNSHLYLIFEPNCIMDGTAANAAVPATNGFEFSAFTETPWSATIYGNGLQINNYTEATAASPNGVGNRGGHILYCHNVHCDNCDDGFSSHDTAQMYLYDCSSINSEKGEFLHVNNAYVEHHRCEFTISGLNNGQGSGTPTLRYFDCKIIPSTTGTSLRTLGSTFSNCQIGTNDISVVLLNGGASSLIEDSFINCYFDGNAAIDLKRCYGKLSVRVRQSGGITVENCVITSRATGYSAVILSNFNGSGSCSLFVENNIFETTNFMVVDALNAGYLVAGLSRFFNNSLFGGAAFDADLIAADTGGTVIVGNIFTNPLIGAGNTLNPDDYGYAAGSPAIGAGTGGTNIGFAVGEVAPPAPQQMLYQLFV
jgi:hypothetical protein